MSTNMKVLSWNVSWGSMTGNPANKTASVISGHCGSLPKINGSTPCLINVARFIDQSSYDFVAIQEATKWNDILNNSSTLKKMGGYVHNQAPPPFKAEVATFYDKSKYDLLAVKTGNIGTTGGRPYQILFLYGKKDCNFYIFINLHNDHQVKKDTLEKELSKDLQNGVIASSLSNFKNFNKKAVNDISSVISGKTFKVIAAGDFNDHGYGKYWQGLQPFKYTTFTNLNTLTVSSLQQPPLTCCVGMRLRKKQGEDKLYGDYILVSSNLTITQPNYVPTNFEYDASIFPTSDHLPVAIELQSTNICPTTKPATTAAAPPTQTAQQPQTPHRPYLIIEKPIGPNSVAVTLYNSKYYNIRPPHVDFKGKFPEPGTKYFLGPAKRGGVGNMAIMRDLLDSNNNPTAFHITIYHESAGKGPTLSLLQDFNSKSTQVTPSSIAPIFPMAQPAPQPKPQVVPAAQPAPQPKTQVVPVAQPAPQPKPQVVPAAQPAPQPKPQVVAAPQPAQSSLNNNNKNNSYKIQTRKTLRLLDSLDDPNVNTLINGKYFKGKNIEPTDKIFYPCGNVTGNDYILVFALNDPNKIGYLNKNYITGNLFQGYKLNSSLGTKTLRLQDDATDPNTTPILNGYPHKGLQVNPSDDLAMACGQPTNNGLVLIQKIGDTNTIGYIQLKYMTQGGGAKKKAKKVKKAKTVKRIKASNGQIMYFYNGKRISKEKAKKLMK